MKNFFKFALRLIALVFAVLGGFLLMRKLKSGQQGRFTEIAETETKPRVVKAQKKALPAVELTPRQDIVFRIIKSKKSIEMRELLPRIPGVTERTLRRDLLKLQEAGLILKQGSTKSSSYVLS